MGALTNDQVVALQKVGLSRAQLDRINKEISRFGMNKASIEIVVHNIVKDPKFRTNFFDNTIGALESVHVDTSLTT